MKPKSKGIRREAIGRAVNKLRGPLTARVCQTCAAVVGSAHAAAIAERLGKLGVSKAALEAVGTVCSRCVRLVVDHAVELHEKVTTIVTSTQQPDSAEEVSVSKRTATNKKVPA